VFRDVIHFRPAGNTVRIDDVNTRSVCVASVVVPAAAYAVFPVVPAEEYIALPLFYVKQYTSPQ
jgi:hypothetical protein